MTNDTRADIPPPLASDQPWASALAASVLTLARRSNGVSCGTLMEQPEAVYWGQDEAFVAAKRLAFGRDPRLERVLIELRTETMLREEEVGECLNRWTDGDGAALLGVDVVRRPPACGGVPVRVIYRTVEAISCFTHRCNPQIRVVQNDESGAMKDYPTTSSPLIGHRGHPSSGANLRAVYVDRDFWVDA